MATKQETAPEESPEDLVWAESPATGRKKEVRRDRRDILALAGWKACDPPGDDSPGGVVSSFPSVPVDHGGTADAAIQTDTSKSEGARRGASAEQKES